MSEEEKLTAAEIDFSRCIAAAAIKNELSILEGARVMGFVIRILAVRMAKANDEDEAAAMERILQSLEEGVNLGSGEEIDACAHHRQASHPTH